MSIIASDRLGDAVEAETLWQGITGSDWDHDDPQDVELFQSVGDLGMRYGFPVVQQAMHAVAVCSGSLSVETIENVIQRWMMVEAGRWRGHEYGES